MTVGIKMDFLWYPIGTPDFLFSFFSTIAVRLEKNEWGSKYPIMMKELYSGAIEKINLENALLELNEIRNELANFAPGEIVWNAEDLEQAPPWGDCISESITDLSNYFVTTDGRDLLKVIEEAINEGILEKQGIEISSL